MSVAPTSVLVVRLSSIGDVIHTIPAYMSLRQHWPNARFGWAVEPAAADLVARLPGPLSTHVIDAPAWRRQPLRPGPLRALLASLRELRGAAYELAVDFQGLLKSAVVARWSGANVFGYSRDHAREGAATRLYHATAPAMDSPRHVIREHLHLARAVTRTDAPDAGSEPIRYPALFNTGDEAAAAAAVENMGTDSFAAIHAVANWRSKEYPTERYVEVARALHEVGLATLWIWGPGEHDRVASLADSAGPGAHVSPPTRLPELAATLARARLFVGGDSAPLHLAGAVGTPAVGVFGPTDPARLGPWTERDASVFRRLPCSHCHRRKCPLGTLECLLDLPASEVVAAALSRLQLASSRNRAGARSRDEPPRGDHDSAVGR